jgi:diguanylate cyclase (GGDEF)-like protein
MDVPDHATPEVMTTPTHGPAAATLAGQRHRLDEMIAQIAVRLMSATPNTRDETLTWIVRTLGERLESDVAILRRNDHDRALTVMVAEWPPRVYDGEGPDPLGEVPFDSDPIWAVMENQSGPYFMGTEDTSDNYLSLVESGFSDVPQVVGASVPLLRDNKTWGILAFLHFTHHAWTSDELHALEAAASMIVQLIARLDAEVQIIHNANHDQLTTLPNRRALIDELERRLSTKSSIALLMLDVDRFKVVNDYLGHATGDQLLCVIADRLRVAARDHDFPARLGGDEFVLLLDNITDPSQAYSIAERILSLISTPADLAGQVLSHTASIGIALSRPNTTSPTPALDLLGRADVAMYAAKARGRNQAVIYDDALHDSVTERSHIELSLAEAIENNGLRLYFQPEVDIETGDLLAVEALVRWEHPVRGTVNAAEFISVAEETGLITRIGRWVFEQACAQLSTWDESYPDNGLVMRVNMSPVDFRSPDLLDFIKGCLALYSVPPSRVCIEITEHAVLESSTHVSDSLTKLREIGLAVAIDDFGTGFASMTELKNIPTDFLKLDMSFVQGITTSRYDRAIVSSIITLADALDLQVIGEGVESADVAAELLSLGCTRAQGYLYSKPAPPSDLDTMLSLGRSPSGLLHLEVQ